PARASEGQWRLVAPGRPARGARQEVCRPLRGRGRDGAGLWKPPPPAQAGEPLPVLGLSRCAKQQPGGGHEEAATDLASAETLTGCSSEASAQACFGRIIPTT